MSSPQNPTEARMRRGPVDHPLTTVNEALKSRAPDAPPGPTTPPPGTGMTPVERRIQMMAQEIVTTRASDGPSAMGEIMREYARKADRLDELESAIVALAGTIGRGIPPAAVAQQQVNQQEANERAARAAAEQGSQGGAEGEAG